MKRRPRLPVPGPFPPLPELPDPLDVVPAPLPVDPGLADIAAELERILDRFEITQTQTVIEPASRTHVGLTQELTIPNLSDGTISIPVTAEVAWSVQDGGGSELVLDRDFSSPDLATAPTSFLLRPGFVELTEALDDLDLDQRSDARNIRATVTLTALTSQVPALGLEDVSKTVPLDLPVRLLKLPVPTILALFRHTGFRAVDPDKRGGRRDGAVLLLVPTGSPFAGGPLRAVNDPLVSGLTELTATLEALKGALPDLGDAVTFLNQLKRLVPALNAHLTEPSAAAVVALRDMEPNLNQVDVIDRQGVLRNDIEANNEMSSLIFVARPERVAHCYNKRQRDAGRGHLKLKTALELSVLIADLHVEADTDEPLPGAEPADGAVVLRAPWRTFGNTISSFEFTDEATRARPPRKRPGSS